MGVGAGKLPWRSPHPGLGAGAAQGEGTATRGPAEFAWRPRGRGGGSSAPRPPLLVRGAAGWLRDVGPRKGWERDGDTASQAPLRAPRSRAGARSRRPGRPPRARLRRRSRVAPRPSEAQGARPAKVSGRKGSRGDRARRGWSQSRGGAGKQGRCRRSGCGRRVRGASVPRAAGGGGAGRSPPPLPRTLWAEWGGHEARLSPHTHTHCSGTAAEGGREWLQPCSPLRHARTKARMDARTHARTIDSMGVGRH